MKTTFLLLCLPAALAAQMIEGGVYDAVTGAPLAGASVSTGAGLNGAVVRTDASGHFLVPPQPNYASTVSVVKSGYLQNGKTMLGPSAQGLRIELKPESVITGKVEDEEGFPAGHTFVQAMRYQTGQGQRTLSWNGQAQSDDQGVYRLDNLPAGKYYLHMYSNDAGNWDRRYVGQFLGGTLQPDDSHMVEVKVGETRAIDIRLVKVEGVTVSGRLEGVTANPNGMPLSVSLTANPNLIGATYQPTSWRNGDATFTIRHVPPGTYTLRYGNGQPRAGELTATQTVEIGGTDVHDLVVTPHPAAAVDLEGQVVMREGGAPGAWVISARSLTGTAATAHTNDDGSFVLKGLLPGHYMLQAIASLRTPPSPSPFGAHVVSTTLGEQEVPPMGFDLDGAPPKPLRITATAKSATLSGMLVDQKGQALANTQVVFLSDQPNRGGWATTDEKGAFHATFSDAGDYHVYLMADQNDIRDEDFLAAHRGDFPLVHVVLGESAPVTLVSRPRPLQ